MKLICIDNKGIDYPSYVEEDNKLIVGKEYIVEKINGSPDHYRINKIGSYGFFKNRFISIKEYRKLKLQKLNEISLHK